MAENEKNYNETIHLPKTDFPMRGNLPAREPEILARWEEEELYKTLMERNKGKKPFVLHDGPPYANGDIHMGHALNKILKDIIVRYKNLAGFYAPYVPGWDTHGLPIEQQAIKKLGINRHEAGPVKFRQACREFALQNVENQKEQFKRLGVIGDWDNPYLTLKNEFVATQVEVFGEMAKNGLIYKGLKPVYWCPHCETALAEAEIEYAEDKTKSIFVKFEVADDKGLFDGLGKVYFVIWTTTTWTLPGNVAVCLNPDFEYSAVKFANGETYILASELVEGVVSAANLGADYEVVKTFKGSELELIECNHPFLDRKSLVIVGDHVTLEAGTGCVHTAPGFGAEDYIVCKNYPQLEIVVPVDSKGYQTEEAGEFAGLYYEESNEKILENLEKSGALLAAIEIAHQYPHCWRCDHPIIFRAADQWFASVDALKEDAVKAIRGVKWLPQWGEERITSMVVDRSDWCISRQRTWGVPIPMFYCEKCGKELINDDTIKAVSDLFKTKGPDMWWELDASEILPVGTKCECGCDKFTKEHDIMDVWFDSGSSHKAVCGTRDDLVYPPDMYLEGNDQYRGWFQSSLLTSIAINKAAPYNTVITHGMIQDGEGRKMSKSKGNSISPQEIIDQYGADVLRLWVVSADYRTDMRMSKEMLKQLSEGYRKIRNTARYILGNISDFDPNKDMVAYEDMEELDKWALMKINELVKKSIDAYEAYEYHTLYHGIHNFCVVDMSSFYLDIIKDRLYTEKVDGKLRRSAQSAMYMILEKLTLLLAPILVYTTEEIWSFMPHTKEHAAQSVLFNSMPSYDAKYENEALANKWEKVIAIRDDVLKALEQARANKVIGQSLAADIVVYANKDEYDFLDSIKDELATIFIVSRVALEGAESAGADAFAGEIIKTKVSAAEGEKCERCWIYSDSIGSDSEHPTLCARCASVLKD
ncbi:MAG: isoleucine--tRNA ligase [Ruminococcaceae bacterium]|nr:isoleucine--tRNA ligase [Oscillospiraceae bacterium]